MSKKLKPVKFGAILLVSILLTLGLSLSFQSLLATWTAPGSTPPSNNVSDLILGGALSVGDEAAVAGDYFIASGTKMSLYANNITGQVSVGTIYPNVNSTLQINPRIGSEGLRIISANNYSPLNIQNSGGVDIFRVDQNGSLATGTIPWARLSNNKIGTLNMVGNQWCKSDAGGVIQCTYSLPSFIETDPKIGTTTINKWCVYDGFKINCESTAITGIGNNNYLTKWTTAGAAIGNSLVFDNGTNVGIGTTSPSAKLEVVGGPIKASGGLIIETRTSNPISPENGRMWLIN